MTRRTLFALFAALPGLRHLRVAPRVEPRWIGAEPCYVPLFGSYICYQGDVPTLNRMISDGELPVPPIELSEFRLVPLNR